MSDPVLSKTQRHYPSLWGASRKLGKINLVDLASLPHSVSLLQVFQEAVVVLQLLTIMSSKLQPLRGSNSRIHRYVFSSLLDKFFVTSFDEEPSQAIPWLILLVVSGTAKFGVIFFVFHKSLLSLMEKGQFLTKWMRFLTSFMYLRLTLLFVPHAVVCVAVLRQKASFLYFFATVLLLVTPLELLLHHVLTFDYTQAPIVTADLVLCAPVVAQEAKENRKTLQAHYAHLLVHGTLHAQGWDHETSEADAQAMEEREIAILAGLGIRNPYA